MINSVSQKLIIFYNLLQIFLKNQPFLQNNKTNVQHFISYFAKPRKFRQNFNFVFREISRNSRKVSRNTKLNMSRNYENKIFCSHPRVGTRTQQICHFTTMRQPVIAFATVTKRQICNIVFYPSVLRIRYGAA